MTFDYHDPRTFDTYTVFLDGLGAFMHAVRYTGRIGSDAVEYDSLEEIPQPHRGEIENRIEWKIGRAHV